MAEFFWPSDHLPSAGRLRSPRGGPKSTGSNSPGYWSTRLPRRQESDSRDGQSEHPLPLRALRGVRAPRGQENRQEARNRVHAQAWGVRLNVAESGFSLLKRQCITERVGSVEKLRQAINAYVDKKNESNTKIDRQFRTEDARVWLRRLYPHLRNEIINVSL